MRINTYLGEPSYVWQEVKMGMLSAGSKLHSVDPATGRAGVLQTQLVGSPLMTAMAPATAAPAAATVATPAKPAAQAVAALQQATTVAALPSKQLAAAQAMPAAAIAASQYEYEAERATKESGCLGRDGQRPEARLAWRDGAVEDFGVQCAAGQLRVRCELGMCRALDQAQ
ncbi:hypothetical protein [Paucibacter soli]|uniref:hypothetical protein n=1 Tax=Paucibacter soli TaxID=3133433 RepID=UPI0030B1A5D3